MNKSAYTVTTVGLSAHDETIVRSVLHLIEGSTREKWEYTESFQADLVLCDPDAALTRIAHKQFHNTGRPVCVEVLKAGQSRGQLTHFIHFPLRASEVIGVLDTAADEIEHPIAHTAAQAQPSEGPAADVRDVPADLHNHQTLTELLMALARRRRDEQAVWQVNLDGKCIYVFEPERSFAASTELTEQRLADLVRSQKAPALRRVGAIVGNGLRKELAPRPIDELLWNLGMNYPEGKLQESVATASRIKLLRWPDFGRLGARRSHFGFAALLTRGAHSVEEIVQLSGQPMAEVSAFLNACAYCSLLDCQTFNDAGTETYQSVKVQPSRWSGLVRIMRSALGMEARAA